MIWVVLIIGVVAFIAYSFFSDRSKMLQRQVDLRGGMAKKYEYLIKGLTDDPYSQVVKVTHDHIQIRAISQTSEVNYFITENFNKVEIEWVGRLGMMGTHKHKWSFPDNYPQAKILEEMEEFMTWKTDQMFGNGPN
jgi:hypothetical protein